MAAKLRTRRNQRGRLVVSSRLWCRGGCRSTRPGGGRLPLRTIAAGGQPQLVEQQLLAGHGTSVSAIGMHSCHSRFPRNRHKGAQLIREALAVPAENVACLLDESERLNAASVKAPTTPIPSHRRRLGSLRGSSTTLIMLGRVVRSIVGRLAHLAVAAPTGRVMSEHSRWVPGWLRVCCCPHPAR